MELWVFMSFLAILIFIALIIHLFAERRRYSFPLVMIILALIFAFLAKAYLDASLFEGTLIDTLLWVCIVVLALDVSSRLHYRMWDHFSTEVLRFVAVEALLLTVVLSLSFFFVFFNKSYSWTGLLLCGFFSWLWLSTTPSHISFSDPLIAADKKRLHHVKFAELSSYLSETLSLVLIFFFIPFLVLSTSTQEYQLHPFITWLVFGTGSGLLAAILIVRLVRIDYSAAIHSLILIVGAWLVFSFASAVKGNGVLAVVTFGLCIGLFSLKKREEILEHHSNLRVIIEILAFFFVAWLIPFPRTLDIFLISIGAFIVYTILRKVALATVFSDTLNMKERWYLALYAPKGVVYALCLSTLVLLFQRIPSTFNFPYTAQLLSLCQVSLLFLIISYISSAYVNKKVHHFFNRRD